MQNAAGKLLRVSWFKSVEQRWKIASSEGREIDVRVVFHWFLLQVAVVVI